MKPRVMFDTGALIALERGEQRIRKVHRLATEHGYQMVATTPVIAEWWRKGRRQKERTKILRTLVLEPPSSFVAKLAGEAIGLLAAGTVDAMVMASASLLGDTVYTSDMPDFERLLEMFPSVQLERV